MDRDIQNELSRVNTELRLLRERIDRTYTGLYNTIIPAGAGPAAPANESYVVLAGSSYLQNERILTAGADVAVTDGGAGNAVTVARAGNKVLLFDAANDVLREYAKTGTGLTAALGAAASGDVVQCPPGTYTGDFTVPAGVTLAGSGWGTVLAGEVALLAGAYIVGLKIYVSESSATKLRGLTGPESGAGYALLVNVFCENTGAGTAYGVCPGSGSLYLYDSVVYGETGDVE